MPAIGARPDLLDRADQPGRAISHDEARSGEPAGGQVAATERLKALVQLRATLATVER
jgi:hypothetical protein